MPDTLAFNLAGLCENQALDRAGGAIRDDLGQAPEREWAVLRWSAIRETVADHIAARLGELDPLALLAQAWCKATELRQVAADTRASGGTSRVTLGSHSIAKTVYPVVTLSLGPIQSPPLRFTLTVSGTFGLVDLLVSKGRLVSCTPGDLTLAACLNYGEIELHKLERTIPVGKAHALAGEGLLIIGV